MVVAVMESSPPASNIELVMKIMMYTKDLLIIRETALLLGMKPADFKMAYNRILKGKV